MRDTLAIIRRDPRLRGIFHKRHVFSTDRLRNGYVTLLSQKKRDADVIRMSDPSSDSCPSGLGSSSDRGNGNKRSAITGSDNSKKKCVRTISNNNRHPDLCGATSDDEEEHDYDAVREDEEKKER